MRPGPTTANVLALAMASDVGSSRHPSLPSTASSIFSLLVVYLWININEILLLSGYRSVGGCGWFVDKYTILLGRGPVYSVSKKAFGSEG